MINEAIKIGDQAYRRRIIDLKRIAKEAVSAAEIAEQNGKEELANKLRKKAEEFEELIANANIDTIDDEQPQSNSEDAENNKDDGDSNKKDDKGDKEENDNKKGDLGNADTESETDQEDSNKESDEKSENGSGNKNEEDSEEGTVDKNQEKDTESSNQDDSNKTSANNQNGSEKDSKDNQKNTSNSNNQEDGGSQNQDSQQKQNKSQSNSSEGNSSDSQIDSIKDPFANDEDIPSMPNSNSSGKPPRDATIDDIIYQLKNLKGDAKTGALDGLRDLVKDFKESLTEAVKKGLRDYSDDEFADLINGALDLIDNVKKVNYVNDNDSRKTKIQRWSNDTSELQDLQQEDNMNIQQDYQKQLAREREKQKYTGFKGLDSFKINFYNTIQTEVQQVLQDYQSYDEINPEYESEDIIVKADLQRLIPEEVLPVIDVYFDCSGSWDDSDIAIGKRAVATVKEFEDMGQIKLNIFYFANNVHTTLGPARNEGGTRAWRDILQNIKATNATNVVVMTDHDMNWDAEDGPVCKVEGCVWWLWKNGESAPECATHLVGKQSGPTGLQYMFNNYGR